jgi:hypothetical protein
MIYELVRLVYVTHKNLKQFVLDLLKNGAIAQWKVGCVSHDSSAWAESRKSAKSTLSSPLCIVRGGGARFSRLSLSQL